jgi:endoglucanase
MNVEISVLLVGLAAMSSLGCSGSEAEPARPTLVHVQGDRLVDAAGAPLALEGIILGEAAPTANPLDHGASAAYAEIAAIGFNHVRLYFNAATLEDDSTPGSYKAEGLAWLDDNLASARENGLYVMLVLGVPPGGTPLDCGNDAFWDTPEYQDRFVALWRMLAARYAKEPVIAGYSLLDPPNPSQSLDQWQKLAERTTKAIREVDGGHTINVSRALSFSRWQPQVDGPVESCVFDRPASESFIRLKDANVVYEFERLQPWNYVAQLTRPPYDRKGAMIPEYGPYPDETKFAVDQSKATWLYTPQDTRPAPKQLKLEPGDSDWTEKTFYYTVTDPAFAYAVPVLQADNTSGKSFFDDIRIEEMTDAGASLVQDLDIESSDGWYFWEGNSAGEQLTTGTGMVTVEEAAHRGHFSLAISNTTTYANLARSDRAFVVKLGTTYRVTSWIKGEAIAAGDSARVRLDFWGYSEPLHGFDRKTLEELFTDFQAWGHAQKVPTAVSLFGAARPAFENDRGGVAWVSDMVDIMREQRIGWAYWGYSDRDFGIYTSTTNPPDPATVNQPLVELLANKLH